MQIIRTRGTAWAIPVSPTCVPATCKGRLSLEKYANTPGTVPAPPNQHVALPLYIRTQTYRLTFRSSSGW